MAPRQTAFPGIMVDSIEVSGDAPPDGGFIVENDPRPERGIMKEVVNRGVTKDFELLQRAADFTGDTVGDFIQSAEAQVGPFLDSFMLTYNLKVRAMPGMNLPSGFTKLQERSVTGRARAFVRAKNPFEPEVIEVGSPRLDEKLTTDEIGRVFDVSVTVTK